MSYIFKTNIANKSNYGVARATSIIKYIVIHYTANDGDSDENNGTYFKNNIVKASAHYFVDSNSVTQSVPDNCVAYSVGGNKYSNCATTGGGSLYGKCNNTNSLSIELCDDYKNGNIKATQETINNAIELTKSLMTKYNIPVENVIRHFDVTGKSCPAYWCSNANNNALWLSEFKNKLGNTSSSTTTTSTIYRVRKAWADASSQLGAFSSLENAKKACKTGYSVFDDKGNVVYPISTSTTSPTTPTVSSTYTKTQFIKDVQTAIGVVADGIVGTKTLNALVTVSQTVNNKHAVVKPLQKYLNALGYNCGTADGIAGTKFDSAAKAWAKANGCVVDGEFTKGGKSWRKILGVA